MQARAVKNWRELSTALRRHWPNLNDSEIESTQGEFNKLQKLIQEKYSQNPSEIRKKLAFLLEETQNGNPNSLDEFSGIERAQNEPPAPDTNEWRAREEE